MNVLERRANASKPNKEVEALTREKLERYRRHRAPDRR
jgi:hypothetical protein